MKLTATEQRAAVLRFWHKVEFFIPFDLQRLVLEGRDAENCVRGLTESELTSVDADPLWHFQHPDGRTLTGFELYLGVFEKALLSEVTQRIVQETLTLDEAYEQDARADADGWTCIAKVKLDAQGEPLLDDVSVSTAPWAIGQICKPGGLAGLDFDAFQESVGLLKLQLQHFRARRACLADESVPAAPAQTTAQAPRPLSAEEVRCLLEIFCEWAQFRPPAADAAPVAFIRAKTTERSRSRTDEGAERMEPDDGTPAGVSPEDEDDSADETEIEILNSFYAADIARAVASLQAAARTPALEEYLLPTGAASRLDLLRRGAGLQAIADGVQPQCLGSGRWFDRPDRHMGLMQQFVINTAFHRLEAEGLFSVNGPPGTGKTTLLSEVIAGNLVRRAQALAELDSARDACAHQTVRLDFEGVNSPCHISPLRSPFVGYEMVVASTNNAAVENISCDLPKTKALGKKGETPWRDEAGVARVGYLQTVAHNLAARCSNGDYEQLSPADVPWGLLACRLGARRHRYALARALRSAGAWPGEPVPKGFDPDKHQSLWDWRTRYQGPSFAAARDEFKALRAQVDDRREKLQAYARLCDELQAHSEDSFTCDEQAHEVQASAQLKHAQQELGDLEAERSLCDRHLELLRAEEQLIDRQRPAWWARWLNRPAWSEFLRRRKQNHSLQGEWLKRRYAVEEPRQAAARQMTHAQQAHRRSQASLEERRAHWDAMRAERLSKEREFPKASRPADLAELERDHWQIHGLWHDDQLNQLRSELFAAALRLHEAWLAEVLQKGGGFGGNVVALGHMLAGKRLISGENALTLWQSLFMVVPVVSSTFASFASQFRDLGPSSIGWLLIDEAGQAVPQAAAGALWRARRALVVGDPLQIEPVFTVPIKLIEALMKQAQLPPGKDVAPHQASVQKLADEANPLGASLGAGENRQWVGSPLRVHRRCVDPMFSIANAIAYDGKMVFSRPDDPAARHPPENPQSGLALGPSAWVNLPGQASDKQVVNEQVELVAQAVVQLYMTMGQLPPIFVITPFLRIKEALHERLRDKRLWTHMLTGTALRRPSQTAMREWCKQRVGTVHTFQGKEEEVVWMVLGCDSRTVGAARWASDKPNLLNVALTRAKHRFFMIGSADLWGGLRHFDAANAVRLPRIGAGEFSLRLARATSAANEIVAR